MRNNIDIIASLALSFVIGLLLGLAILNSAGVLSQ